MARPHRGRPHQAGLSRGRITRSGDAAAPPYAGVAKQLNVTEGAVKVAVHRLRQRYKALLLAHVAETVADESEVEDEVRALFAALSA